MLFRSMNEIFGESNYVETFLWTKTSTPPSLSNKSRKTAEYVLCYEKNISNLKYYGDELRNGDAPLLNTGNPVRVLNFPKGIIKFTFCSDGRFSAGHYGKVEVVNDFEVRNGVNDSEVSLRGDFKWTNEFLLNDLGCSRRNMFGERLRRVSKKVQQLDDEILDHGRSFFKVCSIQKLIRTMAAHFGNSLIHFIRSRIEIS